MENSSQDSVGDIFRIGLIAMAEIAASTIDGKVSRSGMHNGSKSVGEKRAHVKIMVPFEVDYLGTAGPEFLEGIQHRLVMGKRVFRITDPEFEEISHDIQC